MEYVNTLTVATDWLLINGHSPSDDLSKVGDDKSLLLLSSFTDCPINVKMLLRKGVNPDVTDEDGFTPLMLACYTGATSVVRELLRAQADVTIVNKYRDTALTIAVRRKRKQIVTLLLNPSRCSQSQGLSPVLVATACGYRKILKKLIRAKLDLNQQDECGRTPLMLAIDKSHSLLTLLHSGADQNIRDIDGNTPLMLAIAMNKPKVVWELLRHPLTEVEGWNKEGVTPLILATRVANSEVIRYLLEAGANPNATSATGETPLMSAVISGYPQVVRLLLAYEADPNVREKAGDTALSLAIRTGNAQIVHEVMVGDINPCVLRATLLDAVTKKNLTAIMTLLGYVTYPQDVNQCLNMESSLLIRTYLYAYLFARRIEVGVRNTIDSLFSKH